MCVALGKERAWVRRWVWKVEREWRRVWRGGTEWGNISCSCSCSCSSFSGVSMGWGGGGG